MRRVEGAMGTVSANMNQSAAAGGSGSAANGKSSNNNSSKDVSSAKDG